MSEKFVSPCPLPEGYQREVLTVLIEECAEVQQRATKALRFGVDEVQPGQPLSNAARLSVEIGDLLEMIDVAERAGLLSTPHIEEGRGGKRGKLAKFMQTGRGHE